MNVSEQQRNSWNDLFFLVLVCFACLLCASIILVLLTVVVTGSRDAFSGSMQPGGEVNVFSYVILGVSSIATFILPAYLLQRRNREVILFPHENFSDWKTYALGILFLLGFSPCMSLISDWNMQMTLPDAWNGIEQWARAKEDEMAVLTENLVMSTAMDRLLLNMLVMAILPAIGEEFFFRGALQNIGIRIFKNEYIAIWVVAVIFSAIHVQFYGFLPRLLLGVFFGYLVVWTRNIWTAVVAHFVNNSMVVILAFYYAKQGKSYAELMESDSYSVMMYLGSFVFSMIIAYVFYQYTTRIKLYGKRVD